MPQIGNKSYDFKKHLESVQWKSSLRVPHPPKFLCDLQEIISFTIFLYVLSKLCEMYAGYLNIYFPLVCVCVYVCKLKRSIYTGFPGGSNSKDSAYHVFFCSDQVLAVFEWRQNK